MHVTQPTFATHATPRNGKERFGHYARRLAVVAGSIARVVVVESRVPTLDGAIQIAIVPPLPVCVV